jgi:hypothetical protein
MKIKRGVVHWTTNGILEVKESQSGNSIEARPDIVNLTSPYHTRNEGGIVAVPQEGSEILYLQDDVLNTNYYLNTLIANEKTLGIKNDTLKDPVVNDSLMFDESGNSHSLTFKDSKGAGLKVSNYHDKNQLSAKVELKSAANHKVILSDVPKMDCIIIRNRSGDGFTLTDEATQQHSARSLDLKTKISQRWTTREGEYFVTVVDGRDLTLYNHSTGINADANNIEQSGNVNLNSVNRHVNLWADGGPAASGSVFVTTYGGNSLIQLNSSGEIRIYAKKNLEIRIEGDVNVKATGDINFDGANINFNTAGDINMKAGGSIKAEGAGGIDLGDGSADLHLNKPGGAGANPPTLDIEDPKKHPYQENPILPPDLQPSQDSGQFPTGQ